MTVQHRLAAVLIVFAPWTNAARELAASVDQLSDAVKRYEADRETWQKTPDVLRALGVRAGAVVADVGAGGGFFAARLSEAVGPGGTVYAVDINPTSVRNLQERFGLGGSGNVNVVQGTVSDPGLPPSALDGVLIADAYHEMVEHQAMLEAVRLALKPNGRLVILEKTSSEDSGKAREIQVKIHRIESSIVAKELAEAGFAVVERVEQFAANPEAYGGGVWWRMVAVPNAKGIV